MSTKHIVHRILEPGPAGDGIDNAEAAVIRRQVSAVRAISADWYSDLNDAATEAGPGGIVSLSPNVEYTQDTPIRPLDNLTIMGDAYTGSIIKYTGEAGIQHATPGTGVEGFRVFNVMLDGGMAGGIGMDARGFSRCHFDMMTIWDPTDHAIWWGGDTIEGGWSNTIQRSRIRAPNNGAAMHFEGRTSPTGAATANQILVEGCAIYTRDVATSYGVNIIHGEANTFLANDGGYGVSCGAVYRFGSSLAQRNSIIRGRTENVKRAVLIEGGRHNTVIAGSFGLYSNSEFHGAEVYGTDLFNTFRDNWWSATGKSPRVYSDPAAMTTVDDLQVASGWVTDRSHNFVGNSGAVVLSGQTIGEANRRIAMTTSGDISWSSPGSGNTIASLRIPTDNHSVLEWRENSYIRMPQATIGLPTPQASLRGVKLLVHGGSGSPDRVWVCLKNAGDGYEWVQVAP